MKHVTMWLGNIAVLKKNSTALSLDMIKINIMKVCPILAKQTLPTTVIIATNQETGIA
jgi:hypothetical protein